jgi:SAM-dependent methyltransferase
VIGARIRFTLPARAPVRGGFDNPPCPASSTQWTEGIRNDVHRGPQYCFGIASLEDFNVGAWEDGDYVGSYTGRDIAPVEAVLLARFGEALAGPVLELGSGPGRVTRVLVQLSPNVTALDISERMVEACRRNVPEAHSELGDLRDLSRFADGAFRAVVGANNVIDVLGDDARREALAEMARVLTPDGILLFSSHNQANIPRLDTSIGSYARGALRSPGTFARAIYHSRHLPRRVRNRRFARTFETDASEYAIVNDPVHEHRLAHYYIRRDIQARQLAGAGLELVACLDVEGREVPAGEDAEASSELHYAAKRPAAAPG